MNKNRIAVIVRSIISFGLLVLLIWIVQDDIGGIITILKNSNKRYFIVALAMSASLTIPLSHRLQLLMSGQKLSLRMKDSIYLTFIGFFFNNFLPTAIGGDIVKAYYAAKSTNNKVAAYAAVLSDRLFGLAATMLIAIIGLIFMWKDLSHHMIYAVCVVFAVCASAIFIFIFKKKAVRKDSAITPGGGVINMAKDRIYRLYSAVNSYRTKPMFIIYIILLSLFMQGCAIVSIYFYILCIGGYLPLLKLFLIIPIVWTLSMLPSLNGLGVREGAFVYFLKGDIGVEKAFAISLLWLGMIILYSIVGGILHLTHPVKMQFKEDG